MYNCLGGMEHVTLSRMNVLKTLSNTRTFSSLSQVLGFFLSDLQHPQHLAFFSEVGRCGFLEKQLNSAAQGDAAVVDEQKAQCDVSANAYRVCPRKSRRQWLRGK